MNHELSMSANQLVAALQKSQNSFFWRTCSIVYVL